MLLQNVIEDDSTTPFNAMARREPLGLKFNGWLMVVGCGQ
jgi:hypothetical protein